MQDGASKFDRSPDIGATEFRALSGAVTTWSPPTVPRRMSLTWSGMDPDDASRIDRLARRVDGPGPIAVLDPLTRNLLGGTQSLGQGPARQWSVSSGTLLAPGGPASVVNTKTDAELSWVHPAWPGFPVTPGMTVWWWVPSFAGVAGATLRLLWHSATDDRRWVTSGDAAKGPLAGGVPAETAYVTPMVGLAAPGTHVIGASVLSLYQPSDSAVPPLGEGCPAMSITDYSHAAMPGNGTYRDVALTLVEVTNASG